MHGAVEPILRSLVFLEDEIVDATVARRNAGVLLCPKIAYRSANHASNGILLSHCVNFPASKQADEFQHSYHARAPEGLVVLLSEGGNRWRCRLSCFPVKWSSSNGHWHRTLLCRGFDRSNRRMI